MKLLYSIFFSAFCSGAYSQPVVLHTDTFYVSGSFGSSRLWLCSNNSFFIASSNCETAEIAKGHWQQKKGRLKLIPDVPDSNLFAPVILTSPPKDESVKVFQVVDCYKQPIQGYNLILFNDQGQPFDFWADSNGCIVVKKGRFISYFTGDEMDSFDFSTKDLLSCTHPCNVTGDIMLQFNYPLAVIKERPRIRVFAYKGDEFSLNGRVLKSTASGLTLYRQ